MGHGVCMHTDPLAPTANVRAPPPTEYARYQQLRDCPVHTETTLEFLTKWIPRCVGLGGAFDPPLLAAGVPPCPQYPAHTRWRPFERAAVVQLHCVPWGDRNDQPPRRPAPAHAWSASRRREPPTPLSSSTPSHATRLMEGIKKHFPRDKGWGSVPKFFKMRQTVDDIRQFGMLATGDTGPREAYCKQLKGYYKWTNKHRQALPQQVTDKVALTEACSSMDRAQTTTNKRQKLGTGAVRRAQGFGSRVGGRGGTNPVCVCGWVGLDPIFWAEGARSHVGLWWLPQAAALVTTGHRPLPPPHPPQKQHAAPTCQRDTVGRNGPRCHTNHAGQGWNAGQMGAHPGQALSSRGPPARRDRSVGAAERRAT